MIRGSYSYYQGVKEIESGKAKQTILNASFRTYGSALFITSLVSAGKLQ